MMYQDDQLPNQKALLDQLAVERGPQAVPTAGAPLKPVAPGIAPGEPAPGGMGSGMSQAAKSIGQYAGKLEGFGGMLQDGRSKLEHGDSPKYQFARVMSNFDPKGGITQQMLDQLNALGLGSVSGKLGGDKISIGGNVDPRFNGVTEFDIIRDLENGGGWQWGDIAADQRAAQMGGGTGGIGFAMGGLASLLQGNPMAGIQAALGQYGEQGSNLQALLAQLAQGK